jgi:hypothetical protein
MLIGSPDLPFEVLFGYSMILITATLLWMITIAYRKARTVGNRTHERVLLSFIFMISTVILYIISYYRRELVSFFSNPTVLFIFLIPISYVLFAIYKRGPPYFRINPYI